jgi:hypothetical protein
MVSSRTPSLSRGFGISVIATTTDTKPRGRDYRNELSSSGQKIDLKIDRIRKSTTPNGSSVNHSRLDITSSSPSIRPVSDNSRSSTPNTSENMDTDCSYVSDYPDSSAISELETTTDMDTTEEMEPIDENSNPYHPKDQDSQIDVTLSSSTLRNRPFTKPSNIVTSRSNLTSPRFRSTPNINHIHGSSNPSSPSIPPPLTKNNSFHHLNSATKLPRRRSTQQLTKKQKDKLYEEADDDNDILNDEASDIFMYNVPIASHSSFRMFQHAGAAQSTEAFRKAWNESDSNLIIPPSPLPGSEGFVHAANSSDAPDLSSNFKSPALQRNPTFNTLSPTAQQLSTFYEFASHNQAEEELERRRQTAKPQTVDPLATANIDDLTLASSEKLAHLSVSRPSWIPPKKHSELTKHEREFKKLISHTSKEALKNSQHRKKIDHERSIGDARLKYISEKEFLSGRNCNEIRKYIIMTHIDSSSRYLIFRKLVTYKTGPDALLTPPFIKDPGLPNAVDDTFPLKISELFPQTYRDAISPYINDLQIILQPIARPFPSPDVDISKLPKVPALPIQTVLPELARIALTLLISGFTTNQVRDITYWMHVYIFTVRFKESLARMLVKPTVLRQFKGFEDEHSILSVPLAVDVLLHLSNKVSTKCLELLVVFWSLGGGRGVKMLLAIIICVVREYHFGWNNLQVVFQNKANVGIGEGEEAEEKFFNRVLNYYAQL